MWKKIILFLAVQFCTEICAKSIYLDNQHERPEQVPVNQNAYYTQQYGPALQDLALYVQKLQEQGLIQPIVHNSAPFILSNNGNEYGYQYGYPSYQVAHPIVQQQQHEAQPSVVEDKGDYHNFIPSISIDSNEKHKVNENMLSHGQTEHAVDDKKPENKAVISHLNATIHKISDNIEHKVNAIKVYVEKSIQDINKLGDDVYQHVGNKTSKIFDTINKKLEKIETQLQYARIEDENLNIDVRSSDGDTEEDISRSLFGDEIEPNDVDSEAGKRIQSLELLDAEMRGDFKNSITDALRKAQDNFNKLIEDKVAAVNNKINAINGKVESVFNKLHSTLEKLKLKKPTVEHQKKVYTPPTYGTTTEMPDVTEKYTTIQWKPKESSWKHKATPLPHVVPVTPAYYQYTVPSHEFFLNSFDLKSNNDEDYHLKTDNELRRMDSNTDNLETTDINVEVKSNVNGTNENGNELATVIEHDDLQSQIIENLKETLKSDDAVVDKATENSVTTETPIKINIEKIDEIMKSDENVVTKKSELEKLIEDKLNPENEQQSSTDVELALNEELLNEMQIKNANDIDKLSKDALEKNNPEQYVEGTTSEGGDDEEFDFDGDEEDLPKIYDDFVKSTGSDDDDNIADETEFNEMMRSIDDGEIYSDNKEIPTDMPTLEKAND